jgi:riboflavin kinase/FMN adenylyltransferase
MQAIVSGVQADRDMATVMLDWREMPPEGCREGAVTIGNFDGVHRGHAALLAEVCARARASGGPAVALTFDPHPIQVLRPDQAPPVLTTTADRCRLLHELGAEWVVILRATSSLLGLSAAEFFEQVVRQRLAARCLVEGVNFGFGHGREGNVATLAELCRSAGLGLTVVPPVQVDGAEASSSRIRAALLRGDVSEAALLLGRPYRLQGTVGTGQRRGATLGFPTANLEDVPTLVPGDGVYAARAAWNGQTGPAAVNVGPNPTFGENARKVEVHLLDFHGDLYGQELTIDFLRRLRDTRRFGSAAELIAQLRRDVEMARAAVSE